MLFSASQIPSCNPSLHTVKMKKNNKKPNWDGKLNMTQYLPIIHNCRLWQIENYPFDSVSQIDFTGIDSVLSSTHNRFTALFPGPPGWAGARRELLDFMVQGKINRGRHTDHPAQRNSIRTKQCPPPPSPYFLRAWCPSCHPINSIKALKATSAFGLGRRC